MEDGFSSYSSLYDTSSLLQFCNGKGGRHPGERRGPGAPAGRRRRPARGRQRRERAWSRLLAAPPPPGAARLRGATRAEEEEERGNFTPFSLLRYTAGNLPALGAPLRATSAPPSWERAGIRVRVWMVWMSVCIFPKGRSGAQAITHRCVSPWRVCQHRHTHIHIEIYIYIFK